MSMNFAPARLACAKRAIASARLVGMHRLPVDVHVVGAELAAAPGLGQADRIEHVERHAVQAEARVISRSQASDPSARAAPLETAIATSAAPRPRIVRITPFA